jgi:hypothetical protein
VEDEADRDGHGPRRLHPGANCTPNHLHAPTNYIRVKLSKRI